MLRTAISIATFGAFVLMVVVFGFFLWQTLFSSEEHGGGEPQSKPAHTEQQGAKEEAPGSGLAPSTAKSATDEAIAEYTKWLAIFTMFLVLATIGLFISGERNVDAARGTAKAAQDSAEVASKTLMLSQRPWISVSKINNLEIIHPKNPYFLLQYILKNSGPSPGFVAVRAKIITDNENWQARQKEVCDDARAEIEKEGWKFLWAVFPNDTLPYHDDVRYLKIDLDQIAKAGGMYLPTVVGCIIYRSGLDEKLLFQSPFVANISVENPETPGKRGVYTLIRLSEDQIPANGIAVRDISMVGDTR